MAFIKNLNCLQIKKVIRIVFVLFFIIWGHSQACFLYSQTLPIIASHAIRADYNTLDNYKNIEKCGFSMACEYYPSRELALRHLMTAAKTNVKLIIWCPEILTDMENTVREFSRYKSFGGYLMFDEPEATKFRTVAEEVKKLNKIDNKHYIWINIFPIYATLNQLQSISYKQYVDDYIEIVNPSILSFDSYGIKKDGLRSDYYQNLEIISSSCKQKGISFWAYVLTSQYGNYKTPTKGTLSFQAFNNLAYGAQGIEYFSYRRILEYGLNMTCAPIDTNYQIMPIYYDVKELNAEIKYYSRFFYGCNIKEVTYLGKGIPVGTRQMGNLPASIRIVSYTGNGFLVSYFASGKHDYLLFVNQDYTKSQELVLETPYKLKRLSYYKRERHKGKGQITYLAQPGSIILLCLK